MVPRQMSAAAAMKSFSATATHHSRGRLQAQRPCIRWNSGEFITPAVNSPALARRPESFLQSSGDGPDARASRGSATNCDVLRPPCASWRKLARALGTPGLRSLAFKSEGVFGVRSRSAANSLVVIGQLKAEGARARALQRLVAKARSARHQATSFSGDALEMTGVSAAIDAGQTETDMSRLWWYSLMAKHTTPHLNYKQELRAGQTRQNSPSSEFF